MSTYFRMVDDPQLAGSRWVLGSALGGSLARFDDWMGVRAPVPEGLLRVEVLRQGPAVDFVLALAGIPIVSSAFADVLRATHDAGFQLLPTSLPPDGAYWAVNVHRRVDCLDEKGSIVQRWRPEDERPDRTGQLRAVYKIAVDESRVPPNAHMFRLEGWHTPVLVSRELKDRIENARLSGAAFTAL